MGRAGELPSCEGSGQKRPSPQDGEARESQEHPPAWAPVRQAGPGAVGQEGGPSTFLCVSLRASPCPKCS